MKISLATFALISAYFGGAMSVAVGEIDRRQATSCTPGSTVPNPVILTVNPGLSVSVSAESHASNLQQLTVSSQNFGSSIVVFRGSGEDVPMPIVSGGTGNGFTIPAQTTAYELILAFAFSTNKGASFNVPIVRCPIVTDLGQIIINTVTSEDASDNDNNDTIATVVFDDA